MIKITSLVTVMKNNLSSNQKKFLAEIIGISSNDRNENMKDKVKDTFVKIKQFKEMGNLSKDRLNSLPGNATIRE
jgi:hypothetical protein